MRLLLTAYKAYVIPYYQSFFVRGYFLMLVLLLAAIIFSNYYIGFPKFKVPVYSFAFDYCLYFIPFAGAYFLQYFFYKNNSFLLNKNFLLLLFIAPTFFAIKVNTALVKMDANAAMMHSKFIVSSFNYLARAFLLILLVFLFWFFKQKKEMPLYGFAKAGNNNIYVMLLLLMLPVLWIAAGKQSFATVYPKFIFEAGLTSAHTVPAYVFFELCYGFDFLSIEFFFRGFLIFAFAKYAGMRVILPAACFYCCIHLGKPMPEAISSFWGGLLLGIISYTTRSIRGGLFIHLGIAWLMELFAWFLHHS